MLVLVNKVSMLHDYLDEIPAGALQTIHSAKKPTAIIYPGARNLAGNLLSSDGSIGIRITTDPFCSELISLIDTPLVSTSANVSGDPSPFTFQEITPYIKNQVDYVVNWRQEERSPAAPSAIVKIDQFGKVNILRP